MDVYVMVEVSGCPTTCMHCWALGRNYRPMPIEDAAFFLDELARFSGQRGLDYATYPMHEVTAHPAAPDMIRLFARHLGEAYDPILTPGTPRASREDWAEIVAAAKDCGAHALWGCLPRLRRRARPAAEPPGRVRGDLPGRAARPGVRAGHRRQRFLTKPGLRDFDRLLSVLIGLRLGMNITVVGYTPTARGRRYEALRPELADLLPIAQRVLDESLLGREEWSSLESYTEAAWVRRARDGSFPETGYWTSPYYQLVCRPNLDLHTGTTGIYRRRHGNLRRDGAQAVLERGLADGPISQEQLYFPGLAPSISDLAALGGDANSTAIHFDAGSVRYRWLDRQRQT